MNREGSFKCTVMLTSREIYSVHKPHIVECNGVWIFNLV